jgi:hypothetical protein
MEAFGKNICKLGTRWNMENTHFSKSNLFPNKVNVDLDVLGMAMLHEIRGHIDG